MDDTEAVDEGRPVLRKFRTLRHQKIDDDIHRKPAVRYRDPPHELEHLPILVLCVAMLLQNVDKPRIITTAKGFSVETEIDVYGAHVAHGVIVRKQPGNGATDDDESVSEAAEDLGDFDENSPHRSDRSFLMLGRRLRLVPAPPGFYACHESTSRRR